MTNTRSSENSRVKLFVQRNRPFCISAESKHLLTFFSKYHLQSLGSEDASHIRGFDIRKPRITEFYVRGRLSDMSAHTATHCNTLQQAVCAAVCVADIWESLSDMRKPNILIAGNPPSWGVSFSGCFYFKRREGEGPRPLEKYHPLGVVCVS